MIHSDYRKGALVFWETHRRRLIDAIGSTVVKYVDDFVHLPADDTTGDPTAWTMTVVETGLGGDSTAALANAIGGALLLTTDNAENDGVSLQLDGESFELTSDQDLYFGIKLQINDVDQTDILAGLCITDTALLGGMTDGVYFESVDGSASVSAVTEKDSTETQTDTVGTLVDATDHILEFYFDGGEATVYFYFDGALVATHTANIPDNEGLRVSIEFLTGETTANTCQIDWVRCIMLGR